MASFQVKFTIYLLILCIFKMTFGATLSVDLLGCGYPIRLQEFLGDFFVRIVAGWFVAEFRAYFW